MNTETTSSINTALELNATEYAAMLNGIWLASMMAPATEGYKYERLAAKVLAHHAPQADSVVRIEMNLRKLQFARRCLRYSLEVAVANSDYAMATVLGVKLEKVAALCDRRAAELN